MSRLSVKDSRWRINFLKLLGSKTKAKRQDIVLKYVDAEYLQSVRKIPQP
jgi:hypothetical protein